MINLQQFEQLLSREGQNALALAEKLLAKESNTLALLQTLRKSYSAELANIAVETVTLREKAKAKFADADHLYFTKEALEQSTSLTVANYRAQRFKAILQGIDTVIDIGCGIGGDLIAFAKAGFNVVGYEKEPVRAAIALANLQVLKNKQLLDENVTFQVLCADALDAEWPDHQAVFCDPARRNDGKRLISPDSIDPRPSDVLKKVSQQKKCPIAFKLAPGIGPGDAEAFGGEVEFISLDGEMKECIVWLNQFRSTKWRSTLLYSNAAHVSFSSETQSPWPETSEPKKYIYDAVSPIVRAGLIGNIAEQFQLSAMDYRVGTLTSDEKITSPFLNAFELIEVVNLDSRKIIQAMRSHQIGRVTLIKRGIETDAELLNRKCRTDDKGHAILFLTPIQGRPHAILCKGGK